MTKDEIEKGGAAITFTCAGPALLTHDQRMTGQAKRDTLAAGESLEALGAFVADLNLALGGRVAPVLLARIAAGDNTLTLEELLFGANTCLSARRGCGADLKPLIVAAGYDGEEHEAACPKCATPFDWRAPLADEHVAAHAARRTAALDKALG